MERKLELLNGLKTNQFLKLVIMIPQNFEFVFSEIINTKNSYLKKGFSF
jgi:hypothetical protein